MRPLCRIANCAFIKILVLRNTAMKKYLFITGLILLTAMFALAGCGSSKNSMPKDTAAKITVTDDNGRTVSLKDVPQKSCRFQPLFRTAGKA